LVAAQLLAAVRRGPVERNVRWLGVGAAVRAGGLTLVAPYLVLYLRNILDVGYLEIGLLVALTGVVPLLLVPFAGLVTDRVGRRRVFLVCMFAEAVSILLVAFAMQERSLVALIAFATLSQTVGTIAGPAISAYVADFVTGSERTMGYTYVRVGWNVGFTLGVFTGGGLIGLLGFVDTGLAAGSVLLASTTFVAFVLEPSPYDMSRRRLPGSTVARPAAPGMRDSLRALVRDRIFLALCAGVAVASLTDAQWGVTFPLYVNTVLGVPYSWLGAGLAINGLLVVVAQAPMTRAAAGHRHTTIFVLGTGLYVAGFLLLGVFGLLGFAIIAGYFAVVVVLTLGENLTSIPTTTLPSNLAPPTEIGAYNGAFSALMGVGYLLAPVLGGLILAATLNPLLTWGILIVPALPAMYLLQRYVAPRLEPSANRA
jgi:MFS family permease